MHSKVKNKVVSQQSREIIASVLEFMQKETTDGVTIPIDKVQEGVFAATGVSLSSIRRVRKEARNIKEQFHSQNQREQTSKLRWLSMVLTKGCYGERSSTTI
ncbi:unnamed protein product [Acanthoscelides obtectus]|uniref:Uncharacterized protein n=1 Tax=Acanthoscelides obtectus TaxID=200917 RepID=A0A9P0L2I1_ACAOB|nr:unnamed protein product [Acanthoscelides obtectus]CAK1638546.1 hypothetical protein AOBTE_LOCUS10658 [Acanthoscelides obtectus]